MSLVMNLNGSDIRRHRTQRGLSQGRLAEAAGMTQGYLSLIERGKVGSKAAFDKLARALNLSEEEGKAASQPHPFVSFAGPKEPDINLGIGLPLGIQSWVRPKESGDAVIVCRAGASGALVAAIDVAGHGARYRAVATWLVGWLRGRVGGGSNTPRVEELSMGLQDESELIGADAAFFLAIIQGSSVQKHRVRIEMTSYSWPSVLLISGREQRTLETMPPSSQVAADKTAPRSVVHDLYPPWRLVVASDGLLERVSGGKIQEGLRFLRRWQTGASRDLLVTSKLSSSAEPVDDESFLLVSWNGWDLETEFSITDRKEHLRLALLVEQKSQNLLGDKAKGLRNGMLEALENAAYYGDPEFAGSLRLRVEEDGVTVEIANRGSKPPWGGESPGGLAVMRGLCDYVDVRECHAGGIVTLYQSKE